MPGLPTRLLACIAAVFLMLFPIACSSSPGALDEALKAFSGNWKVVSLDRSRKTSNAKELKDMSVTVKADHFQFTEKFGPVDVQNGISAQASSNEEYILQVNPANSGEIDFVHTTGKDVGKARHGLYVFEGETLKICLAKVGNPRPKQIAPGSDLALFVLERQP